MDDDLEQMSREELLAEQTPPAIEVLEWPQFGEGAGS